jgi:hypothetical protein
METNPMKEANSLTYRMVGDNMRATLAGFKLVREFQNAQLKNSVAAIWGMVPKEIRPLYDRTEDLIRTQNEAVEKYLEDVASEFTTISETGGPSVHFDEAQNYVVSQMQLMLEQYDRGLDLIKGQADKAREMVRSAVPKEMHPVLDQSEALLKEQYRAWREGVQKVIPTSEGASPAEQAPKPKRK